MAEMKFDDVKDPESLKAFATDHVIDMLAKHDIDLSKLSDHESTIEYIVELLRYAFVEGHMQGMRDGKTLFLRLMTEEQEKDEDSNSRES